MIKVAIVDDHKMLVEGIAAFVNNTGFAEVVGYAFNGQDCIRKMNFWKPEILLMDVSLPDMHGIDLAEQLLKEHPTLKIIALTTHIEYAIVKQILDIGVIGYLIKNSLSAEVIKAIQTVHLGEQYLCHEAEVLLKKPAHQKIWLTQREKQVLQYISEGFTNPEIAEKLFLSVETIRSYRKNLLFKLSAKNTAILIKKSVEMKLIG